jgi:hypothetical protein
MLALTAKIRSTVLDKILSDFSSMIKFLNAVSNTLKLLTECYQQLLSAAMLATTLLFFVVVVVDSIFYST